MRFDNRRLSAALFVALVVASACQPGPPRSQAGDSAAAPRADTTPATPNAAASPTADSVVIRTDKAQYKAGERITLTFENRSAASYAFNPCTRSLEREENGTWTVVNEAARMCTMEAWILDARGTRMGPTDLPTPLAAGRYRVVVRMTVESAGVGGGAAVNAVSGAITVS